MASLFGASGLSLGQAGLQQMSTQQGMDRAQAQSQHNQVNTWSGLAGIATTAATVHFDVCTDSYIATSAQPKNDIAIRDDLTIREELQAKVDDWLKDVKV